MKEKMVNDENENKITQNDTEKKQIQILENNQKEDNSEEIKTETKKQDNKKEDTNKKFNNYEEKSKEIKNDYSNNPNTKKKRRWIIPTIIIFVILFIALIFSTIFALINMGKDNIMSGVSIENIDMSGLSIEEARGKLETLYNDKIEKEIFVKYKDYESSINPTLIETSYNIEDVLKEAYNIGRESNIFVNNYTILKTLINKKDLKVEATINEEAARKVIEDIGSKMPDSVIEASYYIENDELVITKGKEGVVVDTEKLLNTVKSVLNDLNASEDYLEIPVITKQPQEIDVDKIHDEVYKEAQDAYYTQNPFTIHPEVNGVDFDVDQVKEMLNEDKDEYVIKLTITKPEITVNQIGTEAFPNQLSTFTTRYDASNKNRTTNLGLACSKIDGTVVLPGEVFSYNKVVGERTIEAGYKEAGVYSNGRVVDGLGGGICQISSTLYNAVLMANLEIVERHNHQFIAGYVPPGEDATVVYGSKDFKFKNTRNYPIKLQAGIKNGIATISVYGIKEDPEYTISLETKTISTIPFTTKYIEDSSLPAGTERVQQKGNNGYKTETYKVVRLNGQVVSKTLLSKDTYNAMQKIILRGTKQ